MTRELEALLGLVFGDIAALGGVGLLRDHPAVNLREVAIAEVADALVDRYSDCNSPSLRIILEGFINEANGDPLAVLHHAVETDALAVSAMSWRRFPLAMFEPPGRGRERIVPYAVADSHLHTGGILPPHMLVRGIGQRAAPFSRRELLRVRHLTMSGLTVDPLVLLVSTRFAIRVLWHCHSRSDLEDAEALARSGIDEYWCARILEGGFWRDIARPDASTVGRLTSSFARLGGEMPFLGRCPSLVELMWSPGVRDAIPAEPRRLLLWGLIRACAWLVQEVSSKAGEGLTRFVDRFDAMGLYRDVALDDAKADSVVWALDVMTRNVDLAGAEFRKTVVATNSKKFAQSIVAGLGVHHEAFARFARDIDGTPRALTMPVGWRRIPAVEDDSRPCRLDELRYVVTGFGALDRVVRSIEGSREAVFSTDVAGDEIGSQNWPYVIGAQLLREARTGLTFSIHAGESFAVAFNGVRKVGELFLGPVVPSRIGHALSLSSRVANLICTRQSAKRLSRRDAVMDLCWALHVGLTEEGRLVQALQRLLRPVSRQSPSPDAWATQFPQLFDLGALRDRGVIVSPGGLLGVASDATLAAVATSYDSPEDAAFAGLCWGAPPSVTRCDLDSPLSDDDVRAYLEATGPALEEARNHVLAAVLQHEVILEACPTSNLITSGLGGYADHPVWDWTRDNVQVTVSSDDPLVFGNLIADEYRALRAVGEPALLEETARVGVRSCSGGQPRHLGEFETLVQQCRRAG